MNLESSLTPARIFILGSCVSRDAFSLPYKEMELVAYVARTSLASAFHSQVAPRSLARLAASIPSSFQRRMVLADLDKRLPIMLKETDFDVLLIDLIDERFNLLQVEGGNGRPGLYTLSAEFSRIHDGRGRLVPADSSERWRAWTRGVSRLLQLVSVHKIVLNRAFWADKTCAGELLEGPWEVDANNQLLERMYDYIEASAAGVRTIRYSRAPLADPRHRWGLAPFHYDQASYRHMLDCLKDMARTGREQSEMR